MHGVHAQDALAQADVAVQDVEAVVHAADQGVDHLARHVVAVQRHLQGRAVVPGARQPDVLVHRARQRAGQGVAEALVGPEDRQRRVLAHPPHRVGQELVEERRGGGDVLALGPLDRLPLQIGVVQAGAHIGRRAHQHRRAREHLLDLGRADVLLGAQDVVEHVVVGPQRLRLAVLGHLAVGDRDHLGLDEGRRLVDLGQQRARPPLQGLGVRVPGVLGGPLGGVDVDVLQRALGLVAQGQPLGQRRRGLAQLALQLRQARQRRLHLGVAGLEGLERREDVPQVPAIRGGDLVTRLVDGAPRRRGGRGEEQQQDQGRSAERREHGHLLSAEPAASYTALPRRSPLAGPCRGEYRSAP